MKEDHRQRAATRIVVNPGECKTQRDDADQKQPEPQCADAQIRLIGALNKELGFFYLLLDSIGLLTKSGVKT